MDDLDESPQDTVEPIEIKLGREIVYREGYADKDPIDKLSLNKLKLLQAALDTPSQTEGAVTSDVKGTVNIKAGDELVYRLSKGAVEVNQLHPDSTAQREDPASEVGQGQVERAAHDVEQSAPPTEADVSTEVLERLETKEHETPAPLPEPVVPSSIMMPEPAISDQKPLAAQPLKLNSPNVVSILDVLDCQNQQVVETATRKRTRQEPDDSRCHEPQGRLPGGPQLHRRHHRRWVFVVYRNASIASPVAGSSGSNGQLTRP